MARLCPRCGEIHFETTTSPLPAQCRRCEADLNEASGLMPRMHFEDPPAGGTDTPPPKVKRKWNGRLPAGMKGILIGVGIIAVAGVLIFLGVSWNLGAKEVTAEVYAGAAEAPKGYSRDRLTSRYTVGGKSYFMYPGLRRERETFTVYYLPDDPATGYEMRPFFTAMIGSKLLLIGLVVTGFAVMKFLVARARAVDFQRTMAGAGG